MSKSARRRSKWRVVGRRWGWLGLVPGVFALSMGLPEADSLPTGIPEALGCSGAGPGSTQEPATWAYLGPSVPATDGAPLPVATDGFFVLTADTRGLSAEEARAQLRLRITDAAGVELAGDLQVLAAGEWGAHTYGWSPRTPLAIGDQLNAFLSVDSSASGAAAVGGSFALTVVEAPPPLPEPQVELSRWGRFYRGTGEALRCSSDLSCGGISLPGATTVSVPGTLVEQLSAQVSWVPPVSSSFVAWRLRWQAEPAAADDTAAERTWYYWGLEQNPVALGPVQFPDRNEQHCASIVIEDLRSGETKRAEACADPGPLEDFQTDTFLMLCNEPPSAELTQAWCNLKGGKPPQCAQLEENAPGNEVIASPDGSGGGAGCQLGGWGSGHALRDTLMATFALGWLRRRRKRA